MTPVWPALLAFVLALAACPLLARHAARLRLVDVPDARKQHGQPVPVVGGIAVLAAFALAVLAGGLGAALARGAGPVLLLFVVGLVDDARDLPARFKLVMQVLGAAWLVESSGAVLHSLPLPFTGGHVSFGALAWPLTVLMVVTITNAINLIDGLDGLAGGCLAIAGAALAGAAWAVGRHDLAAVGAILAGAVLGFLFWNARWPWRARAKVFLGDAGALALGMLLCWLILSLSLTWLGEGRARVPLTVAVAPVAVPLIDLVVVAFWRLAEGRNPMRADRGHSHHLLLAMGLSTPRAVRLLWAVAALIAGTTWAAWRAGIHEGRLLGVLLLCSLAYLVWFRVSWLRIRRGAR
ncbi:MAG: MraY family glycosyltransferase [Candidatus Dactylopiibacterium sp.]|nr:MraY family glycosyltransferase [Candidatus Dactylopiibacterium sp.]